MANFVIQYGLDELTCEVKNDATFPDPNQTIHIPAQGFWSIAQQRAMTREEVLATIVEHIDNPRPVDYPWHNQDRFYMTPRSCVAVTIDQLKGGGPMFYLTVYEKRPLTEVKDGDLYDKAIISKHTTEVFDMMVFFDVWSREMRSVYKPT